MTPYKYILYHPKDFDEKNEYPLLIFLHGATQRGKSIEILKSDALPYLLETKKLELDMFVFSPLCEPSNTWEPHKIKETLDEVFENYKNINKNRIYLSGYSMGGYGSLNFMRFYPKLIAAAVLVCSGGAYFDTRNFEHIPIWFFHGTEDKIIEFKYTKILFDKLREKSPEVKLTIFEGAGHEIWNDVYQNLEIYEWLKKFSK